CDFGLLHIPPIVVRGDYNVVAVNYGNGWIRQRATHSKGAQGWHECAHNDLFWLVPANNEASDQHILSGANHSPGRNVGRFSERRDRAAQQSIRFVGELKMTTSGRMNIIPEKILIRIDPRCALGRINCVDEVVMCGLAQDTDHIEPDIEGVNLNGNPAPVESAFGRSNDGFEMIAINRRSVVKCQDPGWIAEWKWVIDDGSVLRAVLGGGAAKCIIGSPIETVFCDCQTEECFFQLLVPGTDIQICRR